jgi:uncharacterized damage-inducible protein DinB
MDANAFGHLFEYHFAENRKMWEQNIATLSQEHFLQDVHYSRGSVRNQVVHMMSADRYWFRGLCGEVMPNDFDPAQFADRAAIRAQWDSVEKEMRQYLAGLSDEMLTKHPLKEGIDQALTTWQILLHVANHGTDHRAQVLRVLHDFGCDTKEQDYIFYVFDHLKLP